MTKYDQAIAEFQKAIQLDSKFAYAYLGLGYSYAFSPRDWAKAIEALETYLRLMPNLPFSWEDWRRPRLSGTLIGR